MIFVRRQKEKGMDNKTEGLKNEGHDNADDNTCMWKEEGLFLYTSCGAKVNAYSDEFKYCPYCSKKIEMVE